MPSETRNAMPHPYLQAARERWFNPYKRYQYSRLIHAVRLGLAVIAATLLARLLQLAHGEWVAITVFVVLGMLQFQGAIYSKAAERMIGTIIGLGAGLLLLWLNQHYLHNNGLYFILIGLLSALAGWAAADLSNISSWIILLILPIAIITGVAGTGMGSAVLYISKKKNVLKTNFHKILYVSICGLIIASLASFLDKYTLGSGKEIMVNTLFTDDKHVSWYLPILRILGPIISFSTGAAGGIFAPSLSAGASIGAVFAEFFNVTSTETNLLILCGMTGFLTSITRSPFTSSILVLEMTSSHNVIFYIMLTALISNLIASSSSRHSFYDHLKDQYINEIHRTGIRKSTVQAEKNGSIPDNNP
jgi:hypothetical protein